MSRADELLPIPPRGGHDSPADMPALEVTAAQREQLEIEERFAPGPEGAPDVRVVVYRPKGANGTLPAILSIHGGAFCFGRPETFGLMDANWALNHQCVVVAVDYRLAPEDRFPAAPEDCYAALQWLAASSQELAIDPDRIAVVGGSAGGALAAAVALMARDRGGPRIRYQGLIWPVLDDRLETPSTHQSSGGPGFNAQGAGGMWLHYLGEDYDRSATSPYAAPMRAQDVSNLPPGVVLTGGLDPLRDEGIQYALRLMAAGVQVELYNAPGLPHGAPSQNERAIPQSMRVLDEALAVALSK